jgi:S-adenosylmethionine:diacylglycerol 3-amino-3-carboxypropyl transferase
MSNVTVRSEESHAGGIEGRVALDLIRYGNCWEDPDILCAALRPRPGTRILSIASAGDNTLALLAAGAEVVAADLSMAQLSCLELRCAAFRRLEHAEVLAFLGIRPADDRWSTYFRLQGDLSQPCQNFWRERPRVIANGIIHAGKFEAYFALFRTRILPLIHSRRTIARLLQAKDAESRRRFYDGTWNNRRWNWLFRLFFGRLVMGRLGRDPEFFRYVEGSVSDRVLQRAEYALTVLPTHENPFLDYIVTGNYERQLPCYLQPERFDAIRNGLDRLTLFHGPIEEAGRIHRQSGFDGFNLSDIFEYLDPATSHEIYAQLAALAKPGARLAYWNAFVPRCCPPELTHRVTPLTGLAERLFAQDRAFFYSSFWVDEVA